MRQYYKNHPPTGQIATYCSIGDEKIVSLILELGPHGVFEQNLRHPIAVIEIVRHAFESRHNLCLNRRWIVHELQTAVQ